jgi:RNA polymerase subunit RPABC4/transcription elongation factor Spt4
MEEGKNPNLKPCRHCGKEVSTEAKACPNCGAEFPAVSKKTNEWITIIAIALSLLFVWQIMKCSKSAEKDALELKQYAEEAEKATKEMQKSLDELKRQY